MVIDALLAKAEVDGPSGAVGRLRWIVDRTDGIDDRELLDSYSPRSPGSVRETSLSRSTSAPYERETTCIECWLAGPLETRSRLW